MVEGMLEYIEIDGKSFEKEFELLKNDEGVEEG